MVCAASRLFSFKKTWKKDSENRLIIRMRISRCTGSIARAPWCQLPLCSSPARLARCNFQSIQKTKKNKKKRSFSSFKSHYNQTVHSFDGLSHSYCSMAAVDSGSVYGNKKRMFCTLQLCSWWGVGERCAEAFVFGLHSRAPRRFIQQYVRPHTKSIPVVSKCNERKGQVLGCTQAHGPGRPQ